MEATNAIPTSRLKSKRLRFISAPLAKTIEPIAVALTGRYIVDAPKFFSLSQALRPKLVHGSVNNSPTRGELSIISSDL